MNEAAFSLFLITFFNSDIVKLKFYLNITLKMSTCNIRDIEQHVNKLVRLNGLVLSFEVAVLTFTLETLTHKTPQHLTAVVTERWGFVGVHIQSMRADLEVLNGGKSCRTNARKYTVTIK